MTETFDAREAGLSITRAHRYLKHSFSEIATLLRTCDTQFGSVWRSLDSYVTWDNSASITSPEQWIPRYFRRFWRESMGKTSPTRWQRALAMDIWIDVDLPNHGTDEPWVGCYVFEALEPSGIDGWRTMWMSQIAEEPVYSMRWAPGLEHRAFEWSTLKTPREGERFQVCGYFLRLTDIGSADNLEKMVTGPLVALANGWSVDKLPQPLPVWSLNRSRSDLVP